jgi:NAD(P)H-dependent FMN reductase
VINILAISGSPRKQSSNTTLLRATALLAPPKVSITIYDGLDKLPPFNPDCERLEGPCVIDFQRRFVIDFRRRLKMSDGVLICSPEYAHGVPGTLKNALDWVVGSGELVNKPVAVFNASPYSVYAHASLIETITVMSARVVKGACITLPLQIKDMDEAALITHIDVSNLLRTGLTALLSAMPKRTPVLS